MIYNLYAQFSILDPVYIVRYGRKCSNQAVQTVMWLGGCYFVMMRYNLCLNFEKWDLDLRELFPTIQYQLLVRKE